MHAISRTDSGCAGLDKEKGRREIVYQLTMKKAQEMLEQGLISKDEYAEFDTKMRQKYDPVIGNLFAEIDLT